MTTHLSMQELERELPLIKQSPKQEGKLELIVRRPSVEEREILYQGKVDLTTGLEGDNWQARSSKTTPDGSANIETQITLMNSRVIQLLTQDKNLWQWAGDQLYVDLDLSEENLPAGTRLSIGTAVIEVTATPHTGCKKFSARFGLDALKFISASENKSLRLRGINARIIQPGEFKTGDLVQKI